MTDDEFWHEVLEERHHWYVYDRMDSFIAGVMAGIIYFGLTLALSLLIPGLIAMIICAAGLIGFGKYHQTKIIDDNRDLWHFEEDDE